MPKKKSMGNPKYAVRLHAGKYFLIIVCLLYKIRLETLKGKEIERK
jgi:hypothetical protein